MLREAALLLLGEDQLVIGKHVVLALGAFFDLGLVLGLVVQLGRETRGPCVVAVSDRAVLDQNLRHDENLATQWPAATRKPLPPKTRSAATSVTSTVAPQPLAPHSQPNGAGEVIGSPASGTRSK